MGRMEHDPSQWFGSVQNCAGDVFAHLWFAWVDWNKLLKRVIMASHMSEITTDGDTSACVSLLRCCLLSKEAWTLDGHANARYLDSCDTQRIACRCYGTSTQDPYGDTQTLNVRPRSGVSVCLIPATLSSLHSSLCPSSLPLYLWPIPSPL